MPVRHGGCVMRSNGDHKSKQNQTGNGRFRSDTTASTVFAAILKVHHKAIAAQIHKMLESDDPDGPHETRIALRRLRTTLRTMPASDDQPIDQLISNVADLGRAVGRLRDYDALVCDVVAPALEKTSSVDGAPLLVVLQQRAEKRRAEVRAQLVSHSTKKLLSQTAGLPDQIDQLLAERAAEAIGPIATRMLRKRWRKLERKTDDISGMTADELHDLRKSVKTLRYAFEQFAPLYPKKAAADLIDALKRLQKSLGYMNDIETAKVLRSLVAEPETPADAALAAGFVLGFHHAVLSAHRHQIVERLDTLKGCKLIDSRFKMS